MQRRSFLALIAGALAVKPTQLLKASTLQGPAPKQYVYRPYQIWDIAVLQPGENDITLFEGPAPEEFYIEKLCINLYPEVLYEDALEIFDKTYIQIYLGEKLYGEWSIKYIGTSGFYFNPLLCFRNTHKMSIKICNSSLTLMIPVPLQVTVTGKAVL